MGEDLPFPARYLRCRAYGFTNPPGAAFHKETAHIREESRLSGTAPAAGTDESVHSGCWPPSSPGRRKFPPGGSSVIPFIAILQGRAVSPRTTPSSPRSHYRTPITATHGRTPVRARPTEWRVHFRTESRGNRGPVRPIRAGVHRNSMAVGTPPRLNGQGGGILPRPHPFFEHRPGKGLSGQPARNRRCILSQPCSRMLLPPRERRPPPGKWAHVYMRAQRNPEWDLHGGPPFIHHPTFSCVEDRIPPSAAGTPPPATAPERGGTPPRQVRRRWERFTPLQPVTSPVAGRDLGLPHIPAAGHPAWADPFGGPTTPRVPGRGWSRACQVPRWPLIPSFSTIPHTDYSTGGEPHGLSIPGAHRFTTRIACARRRVLRVNHPPVR